MGVGFGKINTLPLGHDALCPYRLWGFGRNLLYNTVISKSTHIDTLLVLTARSIAHEECLFLGTLITATGILVLLISADLWTGPLWPVFLIVVGIAWLIFRPKFQVACRHRKREREGGCAELPCIGSLQYAVRLLGQSTSGTRRTRWHCKRSSIGR